jgi:hypothetical protein
MSTSGGVLPKKEWNMKKLENMSDDELMEAWTSLGEKVEADKVKLREYSQEHQRRTRLQQLNLTPGDLEMLQGMSPEGIESEEAVNNG